MGIRHGAHEGPSQVGGARASERERRGTHEKIDAGDLRVENYAAVLSGERAISFWRERARERGGGKGTDEDVRDAGHNPHDVALVHEVGDGE